MERIKKYTYGMNVGISSSKERAKTQSITALIRLPPCHLYIFYVFNVLQICNKFFSHLNFVEIFKF